MTKINWSIMTSEEIRLKQMEISNQYETLKQMAVELLGELDRLEEEHDRATTELNKRAI